MRLLITGGAGFIGSHFVLRRLSRFPDDTLVVVDNLSEGSNFAVLEPVENLIKFQEGDITEIEFLSKLIYEHECDCIVNFAAQTHVDRSIDNAIPFLHSNVLGIQSLIEVCRAKPSLKLLHVSTDEVYGDLDDEDPPCREGAILRPSSPYAASKAAGEMLLMAAQRTYDIPVCISRCTNNYGPHQAAEKFIPTVIRRALAKQPIPVYGTGRNKRDWLFVEDHCDALELLLNTPWAFRDPQINSGHIFNVSAQDERENLAVARIILDILGKPHDLIRFVEDRPGHDWRYGVDSSAIRKLGWQPKVSFEEGIRKTVQWFKQHLTNLQ